VSALVTEAQAGTQSDSLTRGLHTDVVDVRLAFLGEWKVFVPVARCH
jgi:hypothetical protein